MKGKLFDPLRRKYVAATPEEEVRQWFIGILRDVSLVPIPLMMSETGFKFGEKQYRADILVYDRSGAPALVVECKRPDVELTGEVARQAMMYNAVLSVRFIILTNGNHTQVYKKEGTRFASCDHVPSYSEIIG